MGSRLVQARFFESNGNETRHFRGMQSKQSETSGCHKLQVVNHQLSATSYKFVAPQLNPFSVLFYSLLVLFRCSIMSHYLSPVAGWAPMGSE